MKYISVLLTIALGGCGQPRDKSAPPQDSLSKYETYIGKRLVDVITDLGQPTEIGPRSEYQVVYLDGYTAEEAAVLDQAPSHVQHPRSIGVVGCKGRPKIRPAGGVKSGHLDVAAARA